MGDFLQLLPQGTPIEAVVTEVRGETIRIYTHIHVYACTKVFTSSTHPPTVTQVEKPKLSVRLSCMPLDMDPDRHWPRPSSLPPLDRYFDERAALADYQDRVKETEEKVREGRALAWVILMYMYRTNRDRSTHPTP